MTSESLKSNVKNNANLTLHQKYMNHLNLITSKKCSNFLRNLIFRPNSMSLLTIESEMETLYFKHNHFKLNMRMRHFNAFKSTSMNYEKL